MAIFSPPSASPNRSGGASRRISATKRREVTDCRAREGVPLARRVSRRRLGWDHRGAEASEARRRNSEHLRLDIEDSDNRLSAGRKGALPPAPPERLCSFPVVQSCQPPPPSTSQNVLPLDPLFRTQSPPTPPFPARVSGEGENVVVGADGGSSHAVGLTHLCLQEAFRLRCGTSEREHVSRVDGDESGARAVAARRGPSGFAEWRNIADLHHW